MKAGHAKEPNSFPLARDPRALCSNRVPVFPRCALNALEMCVSVRSRSHDPAKVSSANGFLDLLFMTLVQIRMVFLIVIREIVRFREIVCMCVCTQLLMLQSSERNFPQT